MALQDQLNSPDTAPASRPQSREPNPNAREMAESRQEARKGFRERQVERLQAERGESPAPETEQTAGPVEDQQADVRETDDVSPEQQALDEGYDAAGETDAEAVTDEATTDDLDETGGDELSAEDSQEDSEFTQLQARVEQLEGEREDFERGFRQKTHKLAENHREVEDRMVDLESQANFFLNLANQGVMAFEGVDWQALRVNPEEYQRRAAEYQTAINNRDRLLATQQQIAERNRETRERLKQQQARTAVDMLGVVMPKWDQETFNELHEYAVKKSGMYTTEEFQDITDWRTMKLLQIANGIDKAPKDVKGLKVVGGKKAPRGQQRKPVINQKRDAQGRFIKAREEAFSNPGDRQATRNMFAARLAAERQASGR